MSVSVGPMLIAPMRVLTISTTQAGTPANTTETDLWTYSVPAGTLAEDGRGLRLIAFGSVAANTFAKTINAYFGATLLQRYNAGTANNLSWIIRVDLVRTGAATQVGIGELLIGGTHTNNVLSAPTETLTNAITLRVSGQNGTASANDIVFRGARVEYL